MARNSIVMLPTSVGQLNVSSPAFKAAGYYGYASGVHSVSWKLTNFVGRVYVEVSLATSPTETDWDGVNLSGFNSYIEFPQIPTAPTGTLGDTGIQSFTFQANVVWVRIRVDRSYLTNPNINNVGILTNALLNF